MPNKSARFLIDGNSGAKSNLRLSGEVDYVFPFLPGIEVKTLYKFFYQSKQKKYNYYFELKIVRVLTDRLALIMAYQKGTLLPPEYKNGNQEALYVATEVGIF